MSRLTALRAADRIARTWKNGGGFTEDICVRPPGSDLETFDWRLSIAKVGSAGPFSQFANVDRYIAILAGRLALDVEGLEFGRMLDPASEPFAFPGDAMAFGTPSGGPVIDLNLMVRRGTTSARLHRFEGCMRWTTVADTSIIVMLSNAAMNGDATTLHLARLDGVEIEGRVELSFTPAASFYVAEITQAG